MGDHSNDQLDGADGGTAHEGQMLGDPLDEAEGGSGGAPMPYTLDEADGGRIDGAGTEYSPLSDELGGDALDAVVGGIQEPQPPTSDDNLPGEPPDNSPGESNWPSEAAKPS